MRDIIHEDLSIVPQSLTVEHPEDISIYNMSKLSLGVVLDVHPADREENRSSVQKNDRRGFVATCDVLVISDGTSSYTFLPNVIIPPDAPSGLDDYVERLPRGTSSVVVGTDYNANLHNINPYELDGDWCVVGFLGGQLDTPFILKWWNHPANPYDAATSGFGNKGDTLVQDRRYFRRTNGVETVITSKGDIIISTTFANSKLQFGPDAAPVLGRFNRRQDPEIGGSIKVYVKPSQTMEIDFNTQIEGIGTDDSVDPELPQTNPPQTTPQPSEESPNTRIYISETSYKSNVPADHHFTSQSFLWDSSEDTIVTVGTDFTVTTEGNTTITTGNVLELEGTQIKLGESASTEPVIKGSALKTWLKALPVLTAFGPALPDASYVDTLIAVAGSTKTVVE